MKKMTALVLSLALLLALGFAPAAGATNVGADGTVTTIYESAEVVTDKELPPFKVLVNYATFTDKLGSQFKSSLEYLSKALNIEFTFMETGMATDESMAAIEAALINGYDGAIGVTSNEATIQLYQKANVPYVVSGGMPATEELAKTLATYDVYLGSVVVDDYGAGRAIVEALYRDGSRNIMFNGLQRGLSGQHDQRAFGVLDAIKEYPDMKLIVENYDYMAWADSIATVAATYPELDGVACTALNEAIYNTVINEGLTGYVRLGGIDITEGTGPAFEQGILSYIAGGNYVTEMIAFAVLYNYMLDGTRVIADPTVNLVFNNININNIEEYNQYVKYLDSGIPAYTAQEILEMTHYHNEAFDAAAMTQVGQNFTLEDVVNRHKDLFKD